MPIEITVTVKSMNHGDETVITKTYSGGDSNAAMDGSVVRHRAGVLAEHIASQLDKLVTEPLVDPLAEGYLTRRMASQVDEVLREQSLRGRR